MNRRSVMKAFVAVAAVGSRSAFAAGSAIEVFKDPDCGCCAEWVKHLQSAGFTVNVTHVADTAAIRRRLGMPDQYGACHTATIDGYVIEGHVPAADVRRLLRERPLAVGLSVAGMPAGAPGMEVGNRVDAYDVVLVDRAGRGSVFSHHPGR